MGRTLISDFVADPAGNVVGGSGYEVYVYAPETTTARTCYLASTGPDTLATPFTPNAGVDTTLTTQALPADASLVVASSSGFFVGNVVPIQSGANRTEVVIKAIPDATHLTLEAAVGGAVTYPVGSSVGGEEMTGHYQAYVDNTDNTDAVYKNTGTGKSAGRVRFNTKAPQNYQTIQDEGVDLTQRAKVNFVGDGVTASDDAAGGRTKVEVAPWMPNLIPNSDFSRRTKWMTFMPEVFADTSGYRQIDAGAAPTVAANALTFGAANNEVAWPKDTGGFVWRDVRASAQYQTAATGNSFALRLRIDANNYIEVVQNNATSTLKINKNLAGTVTEVASVAAAVTPGGDWGWLEVERQGTTIIGKVYDSGAAAAAKSAATLVATATGTVSDAGLLGPFHISITGSSATAKWGGLATGDGGVYVEGWGPESWAVSFGGTLGGQAIGFDEAADSGPIEKQWAVRAFVPAASRTITCKQDGPDGGLRASTAYAQSVYLKTSGKGGTGDLVRGSLVEQNSAQADGVITSVADAAETTWTRKNATVTTAATVRRFSYRVLLNPGSTATGTAFFLLPQLEQGTAATAWRNAPADPGDQVIPLTRVGADITTTSVTFVESDSRDLAVNVFCPVDGTLTIEPLLLWLNNGAGNLNWLQPTVDGVAIWSKMGTQQPVANYGLTVAGKWTVKVTAGKHRVALTWRVSAGTGTIDNSNGQPSCTVTFAAGK